MSAHTIIRCFICYKKLELGKIWPSIRTQCTTYTATPIKIYLEQLTGDTPLTQTDDELDEIVLCEECQLKINDYDLACSTARNIENDLRTLLTKSKELSIKPEVVIKEETVELDVGAAEDDDDNYDANDHLGSDLDDDEDEEKPLIRLKIEQKLKKKRLATAERSRIRIKKEKKFKSDDGLPKKPRGRPKNLNKVVIRRIKSDIPDSEVPQLLKCTICSLQMTTIVAYKRHVRTHYKVKEREFRCSKCRAKYKNQAELDAHIEKHKNMTTNNPLQCVECDKVFSTRTNLIRHIPIHTGETLYICELCGREYIHHSSFREHKAGHFNIKTKPCPICGRLFNTSSHLARHRRTHTGEKPFTCPICDRKFANKYNMRSHMRIHSQNDEVATYFCVVCNEGFAKSVKLRDHMKRAHHQTAIGDDEAIPSTYISIETVAVKSQLSPPPVGSGIVLQ